MPVMPAYQSYPYMEPPSFVVPQTHLHLMDYRRMLNPQYYQTMAYQSRRFRYQHNSQTREMTNSEVQTEPLCRTERTASLSSTQLEASSSFPVCSSSPASSQLIPPGAALQKDNQSAELKDVTVPSTARAPTNGSFVIQTEEVRIECCATPVGLQLLHSHETTGLSHSFSQDLVQCGAALEGQAMDNASGIPEDQSERGLRSGPDIMLVGTANSGENIPALAEESAGRVCSREIQAARSKKDASVTSKTSQRELQLPFDPKYLDELRKMESMVWSAEESLIPSSESFIKNDFADSSDEKLADDAPLADGPQVREEPLAKGGLVHASEKAGLVDGPGTVEAAAERAASAEAAHEPYVLLLESSPPGEEDNEDRNETSTQDHQDSSFESLPAYLPSASWLADFESVRYRSRWPPAAQKQSRPLSRYGLDLPTRRQKADLECKGQVSVRLPERRKPKGKAERRSLSDHECCLGRSYYSHNSLSPYGSKRDRLCTRCLAKRTVCTSPGPGAESRTLKRKAVPFQQRNEPPLPTCDACMQRSKKRPLQSSSPDGGGCRRGRDTEGDSSENSCSRAGTKCRAADGIGRPNQLKRPLASKQNLLTHPAGTFSKLRERNCVCNELPCPFVTQERLLRCPHGNTIQEMDENCAVPLLLQEKWKHADPFYYQCQRGQMFVFLHYWNLTCCIFF